MFDWYKGNKKINANQIFKLLFIDFFSNSHISVSQIYFHPLKTHIYCFLIAIGIIFTLMLASRLRHLASHF